MFRADGNEAVWQGHTEGEMPDKRAIAHQRHFCFRQSEAVKTAYSLYKRVTLIHFHENRLPLRFAEYYEKRLLSMKNDCKSSIAMKNDFRTAVANQRRTVEPPPGALPKRPKEEGRPRLNLIHIY
jgi:hypothetical protein